MVDSLWNQGCFDFIHLIRTSEGWEIHFVQVTRSSTYSALLHILVPFFRRLSGLILNHSTKAIAGCFLDFVVPEGTDFQLPDAPHDRLRKHFLHSEESFVPQFQTFHLKA